MHCIFHQHNNIQDCGAPFSLPVVCFDCFDNRNGDEIKVKAYNYERHGGKWFLVARKHKRSLKA